MDAAAGLSFLAPSLTGRTVKDTGTSGGLQNTEPQATLPSGQYGLSPPGPMESLSTTRQKAGSRKLSGSTLVSKPIEAHPAGSLKDRDA
jgi:hypothetical protein